MTHTFFWGNNLKRATMQGRKCKVLATGKMNSVLIEFKNGQRECVSRRAIRRINRSGAKKEEPRGNGARSGEKQ